MHVDLSVLVWFVAIAGLLWSLNARRRRALADAGWAALALCAAGALLMALAPFVERGEPVMANYIPVLDGAAVPAPGWWCSAPASALLVLRGLWLAPRLGPAFDGGGALRFGLQRQRRRRPRWRCSPSPGRSPWCRATLAGKAYYEILFWGGGHALQFTWTLLMLVAWLWLASACGARVPLSPRVALLLFALALVACSSRPMPTWRTTSRRSSTATC